jgi:outer membrane protein
MKKLGLLVCFIAFIIPLAGLGQTLKFGHINVAELMGSMPERDSIRQEMMDYQQMLRDEMQAMQEEYAGKLQSYQERREDYTPLVKKSREQELQDLEGRIQEFQATAQQDLQVKQQELLEPLMDKINTAIQSVGKKNGFFYIFDTSAGAVLYRSSQSEDVMPLVKEELGLQ